MIVFEKPRKQIVNLPGLVSLKLDFFLDFIVVFYKP
mgnify:CR=1 FL=1